MNYFSKSGRLLSAVFALVLAFTMLVPFMGSVAYASDGIDVMLVIDDTRSMGENDPHKLTSLAVNKFVDIFPAGTDVRFGICSYSVDILPDALGIGQTADQIKKYSEKKITRLGKGTDAAVGVNFAVEQLKSNSGGRKNAIVLVGDGANSYIVNNKEVRTQADSDQMLNAAIENAKENNIAVYTLAINPQGDEFRNYFKNISSQTSGIFFEPQSATELDGIMGEIYTAITGQPVNPIPSTVVPAKTPVSQNFDVPSGVFEMIFQVEHNDPLTIDFKDEQGNVYNQTSNGVTYKTEKRYTTISIKEPSEGKWTVTYVSDVEQEVKPRFILHSDVTANLSKNQTEVVQNSDVEYSITVTSKGKSITDEDVLKGYEPKLFVAKLDENGNPEKTEEISMTVSDGKIVAVYAIPDKGKHSIYAEIRGKNNNIKSNTLNIDVLPDPDPPTPWWVWLAIGLGGLLLIILIIILISASQKKEGSGIVRGSVQLKIVGRQANDETMIFPMDTFDCEQVFGRKNTLSDLVVAYTKRYRINNTSELAELSLSQFINSTLNEVTDKITISGNKKKQTIVGIPAGYEMQIDGLDINKARKYAFSSPEKAFEIRFVNQGCTYTINLVFTRM